MNKIISLIFLTVLSGCAATIPPAQIAKPERMKPIPGNSQSKNIHVANVAVKILDKRIGVMETGLPCIGSDVLFWKDNPAMLSSIQEKISNTLAKNSYNVNASLIQKVAETEADIIVGVAVEDIRANYCGSINGYKGEASLSLRLEIFDKKTNKSSMLSGSGFSIIKEFSQTGDPDLFLNAVEMATENILSNPEFFELTRK